MFFGHKYTKIEDEDNYIFLLASEAESINNLFGEHV